MSPWLFVGVAMLVTSRRAEAERAIVVDAAGAPFAAGELATAIRVRVPAEGPRIHIRVTATERGVQIEAAGGVREIDLLGLRGAAAARLVALAADDLLPDDLPAVTASAPTPERAGGGVARRDRATLGVLGALASWSGTLADVAFEATVPRDRWLIAVEVGGGKLMNNALNLTAAIGRADVGLRDGMLEARIGLTAAPVIVRNGAGDQTVLLGANLSVRARLPLAATVRAIVALGCDGFATRTTYVLDLAPVTTPQFAPWLAAGLEVGL